MSKKLTNRSSNRGMALFLTLVALAIISILGFGLVTVATSHSKASINYENANKAYFLARTGIARAKSELQKDYFWSTSGTHTLTTPEGTTKVSVWIPASNYTQVRKVWKVTSTGEYGGSKRTLTAWFELETFAIYCYFSDREKMGSTSLWFTGGDSLNGPVHTNAYFNIYRNPTFTDRVTSANETDSCYTSTPTRRYYQGRSWYSDPSRFYRYYDNYNIDYPTGTGNFLFAGGQANVPIPYNADNIKNVADKNYTTDIYVKFFEDGYAQIWYKDGRNWEYDQVLTANLTVHTTKDAYFYSNNCVLNGKVTIAADDDIFIQDSVTYSDVNKDVLGIVAGDDIRIDTDIYTNEDLTFHGTMMALNGSFGVSDYDRGRNRGHLTIFGGIIQNERYAIGTFDSRTGQTQTGYSRTYEYDTKLAMNPPPNYPSTGRLQMISIQDSSALGSTTVD